MKKKLLSLFAIAIVIFPNVWGQTSKLIIDENFQTWSALEKFPVPDSCEKYLISPPQTTHGMGLVTSTGAVNLTVKMIKCAFSPECNSKRKNTGGQNGAGITTGFVFLSSDTDPIWKTKDTIGEFVFGPIPQIDSIQFGHSATGAGRGIRIYKSTNGTTWERVSNDEFADGDTQAGVVHSVNINTSNIYIKFTSGVDTKGVSKSSRLHNIKVWGMPGVYSGEASGLNDKSVINKLKINYLPTVGLFKIEGNFKRLNVYNMLGTLVKVQSKGNTILNIADQANGIYIVKSADIDGKEYVGKIIKK